MSNAELIDRLCDEFEAAWRAGNEPRIADFLRKGKPEDQKELLQELIALDVEYRFRTDEVPDASIYGALSTEAVAIAAREIKNRRQEPKAADTKTLPLDGPNGAGEDPAVTCPPSNVLDQYQKAEGVGEQSPIIGPYKLLQRIGEGGMGSVFMAEQSRPVRRRVALKLIKAGMGSKEVITRFEAERQALAMMDHQNIARVLDAGTTHDGRPFFVMELVNGIPITQYCDKFKLSLNDRLDLFMQTCRAIQHAHQKGIIHRDIKPSNVLVTQHDGVPVVKVIDFGLAKAMQSTNRLTDKTMFTEMGQVLGTLQYMSPEQAELNALDIDTRSDVYSLGILLYELLTGGTPIEKSRLKELALDRILAAIREEEPPRPSHRLSSLGESATNISAQRKTDPRRLGMILRGDLDWIAMKALEKDRARRYDSPMQMAEDVQRYLNGETINARPPSLKYRLQKTIKKHRMAVVTAAAIAGLLLTGFVATFSQMIRAEIAEAAAQEEARKFEQEAEKARTAERLASEERDKATTAQEKSEATLARANYHLAIARWEENRAGDANDFLNRVPLEHRHFEWHLARRQIEGGAMTCYGHTDWVTSVSFSPDGQRIASGSYDDTIKLWDAETGEELGTLKGHTNWVNSISFSHDGRRIVSGSEDNNVKLWDAETGEELRTLKGHTNWVNSVSFSYDGRRIVSGSEDNTVRLWDADSGEEIRTLKGHTDRVTSVSFSPDGQRIASGSDDDTIQLWDAETGKELRTLKGQTWNINSVSFRPDGRQLVSGSGDKTITVWDAESGEELRTLKGHMWGINSVSFSPDGRWIVSGSEDNTVKLWDAETGEELRTFKGHTWSVNSVFFSPDGRRVVSGSKDNTIKLWDTESGEELRTLKGHNDWVTSISLSPDGRWLASGSNDNAIKLWDAETGDELRRLKGHTENILSVAFSPDGQQIASGSKDETVKLWDAESSEELRTFKGHTDMVSSVSFSLDGRRIASGSWDQTVKLWDTETGEELRSFKGHKSGVTSVSFSPDGGRIISGSADRSVRLWDAETGDELRMLQGHTDSVSSISLSPDGRRIVSGSGDKTVKLWDAESGEELRTFKGHTDTVSSVSFSSDGQRIASGSWDQTVKLWDVETGEELRTLKGHTDWVNSVSFSHDGRQIVSGSDDDTVKLWVAEIGSELRTLKGHVDDVWRVSFSPDGQRIASRGYDDTVTIWDIDSGEQLRTLKGHTDWIPSVSFTPNGQRIATRDVTKVELFWDTETGDQVPSTEFPEFDAEQNNRFSDGRWLAIPYDNDLGLVNLRLIDLHYKQTPREKRFRQIQAQPNPRWHREIAEHAEEQEDWYAATFHRAWLLKLAPAETEAFDQFHKAHERLLESSSGNLPPVAPVVEYALRMERGTGKLLDPSED